MSARTIPQPRRGGCLSRGCCFSPSVFLPSTLLCSFSYFFLPACMMSALLRACLFVFLELGRAILCKKKNVRCSFRHLKNGWHCVFVSQMKVFLIKTIKSFNWITSNATGCSLVLQKYHLFWSCDYYYRDLNLMRITCFCSKKANSQKINRKFLGLESIRYRNLWNFFLNNWWPGFV